MTGTKPATQANPIAELTNEKTIQQKLTIKLIPLNMIDDFPQHPYQVRDDAEMVRLVESVKEQGVASPAIARRKDDGRYELISGHRRKRASELAELDTLPVVVYDLTDEQSAILMVDSNCQREKVLPSEKAKAYKIKMEALKKQGKRTDLTSTPVVAKSRTGDEVGFANGDSREQVRRHIRLTELIPQFLEMVDTGDMAFRPAVELSYLKKADQKELLSAIKAEMCAPSLAQALRLKNLAMEDALAPDTIHSIMREPKPNQKEQVRIPKDSISRFFKENDNQEIITTTIVKALELYRAQEITRSAKRKDERER